MRYQLVAIDIDGTLLNDFYQVSEGTIQAMNQTLEICHVVLCTGRSLFSSKRVLAYFGRPFPLITDNGATLWDPEEGVLYRRTLNRPAVRQILRYCRDMGFHVDFTTSEGVYVEAMKEEMLDMYRRYHTMPEQVEDLLALEELPVKITITGHHPPEVNNAYQELVETLGAQVQFFQSSPYFIDCIALNTSKGEGLKRYASLIGVEMSQTIAIGNYYNDVEMIHEAGLGIAVANAPADIRAVADYVTESNNDEGVRKVLEQFILTPTRLR